MKKDEITLTQCQKDGVDKFTSFFLDDSSYILTIQGNAGTGKSTLVKELIKSMNKINKTIGLVNQKFKPKQVYLTATTNKAAHSLYETLREPCKTIHHVLGMRVAFNKTTLNSKLYVSNRATIKENSIFFIDEASFLDAETLKYIFHLIPKNKANKIIFIGDPYQLTPVKSNSSPAFDLNASKIILNNIVRQQQGNPIIDLSLKFKECLDTGKFFSFKPDNVAIRHVNKEDFLKEIEAEFTPSTWNYHKSKVLVWTNKAAINYNNFITSKIKGTTKFRVGDTLVNNSFVSSLDPSEEMSLKAEELVQIVDIEPNSIYMGGFNYTLKNFSGQGTFFCPTSLEAKKEYLKTLHKKSTHLDYVEVYSFLHKHCVDLREVYACTINKSQGSTYKKVFIDLSDIKRCKSGSQIARLLYVAVTRASHEVVFTGDLV